MALSSDFKKNQPAEDLEELLESLEKLLERTKVMFEQYFMGIQKVAPSQLHREVERKVREITQQQIRNTALRFRFTTISQKYGAYNTYWKRTLREIEQGRYQRDLARVTRKVEREGEELPEELLAKLPKLIQDRIRRDRARMAARAEQEHGGGEAARDREALEVMAHAAEIAVTGPTEVVHELDEEEVEQLLGGGDLDMDEIFGAMTRKDTVPPPIGGAPAKMPAVERPVTMKMPGLQRPGGAAQPPAGARPTAPASPLPPAAKPPAVTPPVTLKMPALERPVTPKQPAQERPRHPTPPAFPAIPRISTATPVITTATATTPTATTPTATTPTPAATRPTPAPAAAPPARATAPTAPPARTTTPTPPPAAAARTPAASGRKDMALPPGMTDRSLRELHARYVKARQLVGETEDMPIEKLAASLNRQAPGILEKHGARGVEFQVVVKGEKVLLKAKPIK